ncbi:TRAP transporter small permease [Acuticoccus sp. M5D2P5]|uniref:TRAP transporter small permease n=1 Tax=Acuticoccus kalidii TaxID=2910977 RepID=UPI001F44E083|nr:TRAP transporter small permease [Acuticoccus kalidii]MCF3935220.1 TRAP transporter small permease [Acuticoccus kalidii]
MSTSSDGAEQRPVSPWFHRFQAFNYVIERLFSHLAGAFLALFTVVVFIDVIYRQVLQAPMMWPSEWSVMSFVWSVMLGASVAARRNIHFVVELIPETRGMLDTILKVIVGCLSVLFGIILFYFGLEMAINGMRRFTPMMGYPMVYVFSAFPVAGAAITLFTLERLIGAIVYHAYTEDHDASGGVS